MSEDTADTVLERKAIAQRQTLGVGAVSVQRALARSMSIAADALWALGLTVESKSDATVSTTRALSELSDDQMIVVLENESGLCGLAAFDRALVTGLTEIQTLGKITRFPLDNRPFTPTDAAMVAPLLDAALPRFSSMLTGQPERAHLQGYGFGALVDDAQTASLALDTDRSEVIRLDISLAQGLRAGRMVAVFPEAAPKPLEEGSKSNRSGKYEATMKLVPARMQAILTRIHIPLEKAQALKPGDVLDISADALNAATLVVEGGHVAAKGKMGQLNGFRAVRIGSDAPLYRMPAPDPKDVAPTAPLPAVIPTETALAGVAGTSTGLSLDSLAASLGDPADRP